MLPQVRYCLPLLVATALLSANGNTAITFTRDEVNTMASLWETDCVSVSPLPNAQYPTVAGTWDFILSHSSISSDGDIHIDMAINSIGTGATGNNTGASPLICEVINATSTQLSHLSSLNNQQATFRGIFRFYTEHSGERHFELHPVTQLQRWNGATFVQDTDFLPNIAADPDGATHGASVLTAELDGSQKVVATIEADNHNVDFSFPSPSVNYVQYAGTVAAPVQSDALGQYFFFRPDLVPGTTIRCRLITNSAVAAMAITLATDQSVTVNALTRTDMSAVAAQIATMAAGEQKSFGRPIELIVLGLSGISPGPTPTPTATPSATPSPTPIGQTFSNATSIVISGAGTGKGSPYPSAIAVSGLVGKVTRVTAQLAGISEASNNDYASDIDIQLAGPGGPGVMLISDAGGTTRLNPVTLTFDDAAANSLPRTSSIANGTYKPTNYTGDSDSFPSPAPTTTGGLLSVFNNTDPNGIWNLFVLNEYFAGRGSISGGWNITIETTSAPPLVTTGAASLIASTAATLGGMIDPLGQGSSYQFQLGADANYGFTQVVQSAGSGSTALPVTLNLSGLRPGTTYHFRLTGGNSAGSAAGIDRTFTTPALVDSDGDGMSNDYEMANGLNPNNGLDANADADGDGMTNLKEYLAGTNPRSATSVLRVSSLEKSGGDIVIGFPSVLGKTYSVEESVSPAGPWTLLSDNLLGSGDILTVVDVEAADDNRERYYRVSVKP